MTSRRTFVSCASHIALVAAVAPRAAQAAWARRVHGPLVAVEPFGRLEKVAEGVWALISTPLTDPTTVSNGGIIAGRNGVLAIEGFNTPKGAQWIAEQALALTGKRPSHVIVTHYHADHANGVAG
ncbi:MAG: MBL fold metallo-hydrolase, partial [Gemmatimonadaceae bacterium]